MRFWAASLVLLLVLLSLVAATGKHAKNSKAKHPVHKQVAHKHAPAHKKPAHHGPAHRAVHHHVQKKRTNKKAHRNVHKKGHKGGGGVGRLRMSKHVDKHRMRAIRAGALCEDLATNCRQVEGLCGAQEFASILQRFCKMECGFCKPPQNKCKDKLSKCTGWARSGFCTHPIFPLNLRRSMCAKSCKMCGGKTNCNLGPNKFLKECLSTTCAKKSYQKKSQCKAFCKSHEKVCGGGKPGPEPEEKCGKPEEKYKPDCIEETCTSDEEKGDKQSKECKEWCEKDEANKAKCAAPPPKPDEKNCKDEKQKYEKDCLAETCGTKEELEKPSDKCKEFCSATPKPPSCDADCAPASDKRYEEKCWPATCIRPEEQGDKQNAACKTWCEKAENKDKCKGDDKPKPTAPDCTKPETKFTEECLPTTCPTAKDEAACKLYCGRAKKDDKACTGVTAITCDAAKTDAECLPHFCRIAANKDNAACIPYCKTKPEEKGECVGVSPEVDTPAPPGKGCETKTNNDRFDTDNCWQYSCKKQALKTEAKCVEHCNVSPEQEDFACAAVAPGAAAAACTADEFANDACTKHACRVQTNKANDKCKDYCDKNKKDKVCIGVEPKPDAKCDAEDKKYTQECISYTCRKTAEKDKPECENLCLYKADDDACAL